MQPLEQGRPWRWGKVDREAIRRSLEAARTQLEIELAPAGTASVRAAYEMLSDAYQSKGSVDPAKRVRLWVMTFGDWPHCALQEAVRAWAHKDTPYMPSPGQFHAVGAPAIERRRTDLADVVRVLRIIEKPEDKDWDSYVADPEVIEKLRRMRDALRRGEDLGKLRADGLI